METSTEDYFGINPMPGINYPLKIQYCGNCTMPVEYCEYYPSYDKCKEWLEKNLPDVFERMVLCKSADGKAGEQPGGGGDADGDVEDDKKRQKRGGKGMVRVKKKDESPKKVTVYTAPRGRKKLTVVTGLKTFDLDLKVCSKAFGQKFACGSSVTGSDEIVIQGDIKDDVIDFILEKWPLIDEDSVEDGGEHKR